VIILKKPHGNHDSRYYTKDEVDTISGSLPTTLLELEDTPTTYSGSVGKYLVSTGSETIWDSYYTNMDGGSAASNYGGVPGVDGGNAN